ncbi:hypothetical protein WA026_011932 [Henosepilachna vigintioctopunctata]|uniref:GIY-YIG homing endonuclease n=1 Tax=Henosepilachna vigintioctopunctata TaxID=420089 RepID=A0AAW1UHV9_9CUCU
MEPDVNRRKPNRHKKFNSERRTLTLEENSMRKYQYAIYTNEAKEFLVIYFQSENTITKKVQGIRDYISNKGILRTEDANVNEEIESIKTKFKSIMVGFPKELNGKIYKD